MLPEDATIKWVATYYKSFWALSSKIDIEFFDGANQSYFLKVSIFDMPMVVCLYEKGLHSRER